MQEVVQAVTSLIAFPLNELLGIFVLVVFTYWFVVERPKERKEKREKEKEYNGIMKDLTDVMTDYKVQIAQNASNYDKLADYSIRVVENNTLVLQSILLSVETLVQNVANQLQNAESSKIVHQEHDTEVLTKFHNIELALTKLLERR